MKRKAALLTEGAIAVSLTIVLSYLKVWQLPQGGSVTLENVPLLLFALRNGGRAGLLAGFLAGTLQILLGGYVVHPLQGLLDYPLAFAALGLAGFFPGRWMVPGILTAGVARFLFHVLSGVVFFASYAPEGTPVWLYSVLYNGTFLLPSIGIALALLLGLKRRLIDSKQAV